MKLYKIIPNERRITEIDYTGDYDEMRRNLPYEWLDTFRFNQEGDYLFLNDIGLLDGTPKKHGVFYIWNGIEWRPISGMALVFGCDHHGETISPHITIEQLENLVRWK